MKDKISKNIALFVVELILLLGLVFCSTIISVQWAKIVACAVLAVCLCLTLALDAMFVNKTIKENSVKK